MGVKQPSDKLYQVVSVADFLTARRIEATTLPELSWESWTGNATMPISWTELQSSFFHWISEGLGYVPADSYKSRLFNEHLIAALHNKCLMFCLRKTECKNEKVVTMGSVGLRGFRTRPWMGVVSVDILSLSLSLSLSGCIRYLAIVSVQPPKLWEANSPLELMIGGNSWTNPLSQNWIFKFAIHY